MGAMRLSAVFSVLAWTTALAQGTRPDGECAATKSVHAAEDSEESGFVQQKVVRHVQPPENCTRKSLGEMCLVNAEDCNALPAYDKVCPCDDGLVCIRIFNETNACRGYCRAKDGQFCKSDEQCIGGVCAGNLGRGGLCKTRAGGFSINLIDVSNGTSDEFPQFKLAFDKAAARYAQIIQGQVLFPDDFVVDIEWSVEEIDGPGRVLGFAGPTFVSGVVAEPYGIRWLAAGGIMVFDVEDLLRPEIAPLAEAIILHEMAHVLGIGTLQEPSAVLPPFPSLGDHYDMTDCEKTNGADGRYKSLDGFATAAYLAAKGYIPTGLQNNFSFTEARLPPIETDFGPGTQCGHWDEATLDNELMTGFIGCGPDVTPEECAANTPLSRITIGGFEDLGYVVDYGQADRYLVPVADEVLAAGRRSPGFQIDEHMETPTVGFVSPGGRADPGVARRHTDKELDDFRKRHAKKKSM